MVSNYHYKTYCSTYGDTPIQGRTPDDWQPRVKLKKEHVGGNIVQPRHVVDHLQHLDVLDFKKKKRSEE